mgnify:CR=1 FL=1
MKNSEAAGCEGEPAKPVPVVESNGNNRLEF